MAERSLLPEVHPNVDLMVGLKGKSRDCQSHFNSEFRHLAICTNGNSPTVGEIQYFSLDQSGGSTDRHFHCQSIATEAYAKTRCGYNCHLFPIVYITKPVLSTDLGNGWPEVNRLGRLDNN